MQAYENLTFELTTGGSYGRKVTNHYRHADGRKVAIIYTAERGLDRQFIVGVGDDPRDTRYFRIEKCHARDGGWWVVEGYGLETQRSPWQRTIRQAQTLALRAALDDEAIA